MGKQGTAVQVLGMSPKQVGTGWTSHGYREDSKDQDS